MTLRMPPPVLVYAAGLGTRLRPLTNTVPKPLIPFCGVPLIGRTLENLSNSGFRRVFINLHYLGNQIREYIGDGSSWNLEVSFLEEPVLLDTGGTLAMFYKELFADGHLVTINSDTVLDETLDFSELVTAHRQGSQLVTAVVRDADDISSYGILEFDASWIMQKFLGEQLFARELGVVSYRRMYTGVQVISANIGKLLPEPGTVCSVTRDLYPLIYKKGGYIRGYEYKGFFSDVGTETRLRESEAAWQSLGRI